MPAIGMAAPPTLVEQAVKGSSLPAGKIVSDLVDRVEWQEGDVADALVKSGGALVCHAVGVVKKVTRL
jgi:hypothetical protein